MSKKRITEKDRRRAAELVQVRGLPAAKVARMFGVTEASVRNWLKPATRGIYAIVCPETGDVVYIGQSVNIEQRFAAHISGGAAGGLGLAKRRWVLELRSRGLTPELRILERCPPGADMKERERHYIQLHKLAGDSLRFMTHGRVPEARATQTRRQLVQRIANLEEQQRLLCLCFALLSQNQGVTRATPATCSAA